MATHRSLSKPYALASSILMKAIFMCIPPLQNTLHRSDRCHYLLSYFLKADTHNTRTYTLSFSCDVHFFESRQKAKEKSLPAEGRLAKYVHSYFSKKKFDGQKVMTESKRVKARKRAGMCAKRASHCATNDEKLISIFFCYH